MAEGRGVSHCQKATIRGVSHCQKATILGVAHYEPNNNRLRHLPHKRISTRFSPEKQAFNTSKLQDHLRSLSSCCPVVVQLLSVRDWTTIGQQSDNERTTTSVGVVQTRRKHSESRASVQNEITEGRIIFFASIVFLFTFALRIKRPKGRKTSLIY